MPAKILQTALDALHEIVFILDKERQVLFVNAAGISMFGINFVGSDFVQIIRQPDCIGAIGEVLDGCARIEKTISIKHPDRAMFRLIVADLGDDNRDGAKVLVSLNDISDLRDAEIMRSDFVANVSHELRSPLTALSGFIETLKGPARDDETARIRFLDLMQNEAHRMTRLIADLLSLSKVEASLRQRPDGEVDVASILENVKATLADQATKETKEVIITIGTGIGRVIGQFIGPVNGNEDELTQVFQNLLENALKYGASNSVVTIHVENRQDVAGIAGPALAVEVRDQGEGIARPHIARLTERFYRVDRHRSRDKGGTGLGLAIVKHIINRHRGRLVIASEPGVGSTFTVYLPQGINDTTGAVT